MKSNKKDGYEMSEDVIEQILLRVKVKSLLRFKCVCKKWYALIQNQTFIRNHFNHQSNHLLSYSLDRDEDKYVWTLFMDSTLLRYEQPQELQLQYQNLDNAIGHIDGIFCVVNRKQELSLWNPATREIRQLHNSRPDIAPHYHCYIFSIGFGFEPLTSDYKVVWIRIFTHDTYYGDFDDEFQLQVVSVYTLSSESWRHFEIEDNCIYSSIWNIYLNGFCYFHCDSALVSFDLSKEVFKKIQIPEDIKSLWNQLCMCKDSIGLISYDLHVSEGSVDIWLMNESEVWRKHISIGPLLDPKDSLYFILWDYKLIRRTTSGQVIIYDLHTQQIINLEGNLQVNNGDMFLDYQESLISLKPKN